ncbi:MAG: NADH-quinone oxidoreductase subunit N [Candidatus Sericytochromatia bacterium]|nr:NADH-quinone oxidoreductase subunit N [Candidatus Sericytochromatia bacterium]
MDNLIFIAPYLPLGLAILSGISLLLLQVFLPLKQRGWLTYVALIEAALLILASSLSFLLKGRVSSLPAELQPQAMANYQFFSNIALFFYLLLAVALLATILISAVYLEREKLVYGEYYALLFFATSGMMVLVSANDLMTLFIGLEIMSMSVYALVGYRRENPWSNEGLFKYFLLGALASALLLYGIALTYGTTGTVSLREIQNFYLSQPIGPLGSMGLILILTGLGFKVAAVPFHSWSPDAYQGAPLPITGFMATAVKAAAFALLLKILGEGFLVVRSYWLEIVMVLSALTMITGNVLAFVQQNIKRMLAYSSIAHTGYLLMGLSALNLQNDNQIRSAILYYLFIYVVSSLGVFTALAQLSGQGEKYQRFEDYAGLGKRHPFSALVLTLLMFSFIGIPPLGGFFAKYYLFSEALRQGQGLLVAFAIFNSILSIAYYLRLVVVMYFQPDARSEETRQSTPVTVSMALALSAFCTLWAGFAPVNFLGVIPGLSPLVEWLHIAAIF